MVQAKGQKPAYMDLLNLICLQEGRAGVYLKAWAEKTQDPALRECLGLVAGRETSHYHIFKRRIGELGFKLEEEADPDNPERMRVVSSCIPDGEKIQRLQEIQRQSAQAHGPGTV